MKRSFETFYADVLVSLEASLPFAYSASKIAFTFYLEKRSTKTSTRTRFLFPIQSHRAYRSPGRLFCIRGVETSVKIALQAAPENKAHFEFKHPATLPGAISS
jgi:hypothetical protein